MVKLLIQLSKEYPALSKAESESVLDLHKPEYDNNLLVCDMHSKDTLAKLAFAKSAFIIIQKASNETQLLENLKITPFRFSELGKYHSIGTSYKISKLNTTNEPFNPDILKFAKIPYERGLEKVNLKKPDNDFTIIKGNNLYFTLKIWENNEPYEARKADKRPAPHPTSMNPRIARAMINLSNPKKQVLDPFCGSGGILIEAGKLDLLPTGIDIDPNMISRAKINLTHYQTKEFTLLEQDALKYEKFSECIVTDLPYGRSSKLKQDLQELTDNFLKHYSNLTTTIILACPKEIKVREKEWKIKNTFEIYIHKTLTRKIYVLKKSQ